MKRIVSLLLVTVSLLISVGMFSYNAEAKPSKAPEYVYWNMRTWQLYVSNEAPNCRHGFERSYRHTTGYQHTVYCSKCGYVFKFENCCIDNDRYSAPRDYYHDRCLLCYYKQEN